MNFSKGARGEATLLTFDDARTLFHEFGHGLHGLLSNVTYPIISGTGVARDFVELPSQLYEHWLSEPEVLSRFAVHYRTGEPMPKPLLDKLLAAANFNKGFETVEYTASALVDLELHLIGDPAQLDIAEFERRELARIGMPKAITLRHRIPHFQHVFSGDGYSAGYYSYMWSEVMDADAYGAFEETSDPFDPATAERLLTCIYSAGGRQDPEEAYIAFRGTRTEDRRPSQETRLCRIVDTGHSGSTGSDPMPHPSAHSSGFLRICLVLSGLTGALGVASLALSAHATASPLLATAAQMLLFHAPVFLGLGAVSQTRRLPLLPAVPILLSLGLILFCSDLYSRVVLEHRLFLQWRRRQGGMLVISSWMALALSAVRILPR
ncbi:DUF423 domain-containing protein [Roseibium salinum]|nr:DUF423 domain-containing protein [Roseibium salinum]